MTHTDSGTTVLMLASERGDDVVVKALLKEGNAEVDKRRRHYIDDCFVKKVMVQL